MKQLHKDIATMSRGAFIALIIRTGPTYLLHSLHKKIAKIALGVYIVGVSRRSSLPFSKFTD